MSGEPQPPSPPPAAASLPEVGSPEETADPTNVTPPTGPTWSLGRLTKIEIENYRGVRGKLEIGLPEGENLLVYGENGAGKSTIFHSLRTFLEAPEVRIPDPNRENPNKTRPLSIADHAHRYTAKKPRLALHFQGRSFEWSETVNETTTPEVRLLDKGKGCLDYRSLLRVHWLPDGRQEIDLFDLFITLLLPHYQNPVGGAPRTFSEEWKRIKDVFVPYARKPRDFDEWLQHFNVGFEKVVQDTISLASGYVNEFDTELKGNVKFTPATYTWGPKHLTPPKVTLVPVFRDAAHPDYHNVLNEARLSALAVALYFAALKTVPISGYRLLLLDDILIGLDMANRVRVAELIHKHFNDWQIVLLTYSKSWFERLKEFVDGTSWAAKWKSVVLWDERQAKEKSPRIVIEDSGDALEIARQHLQRKDYTAAAVYARKALEALMHRTCADASLRVLHVDLSKHRKLEHFLVAMRPRIGEINDDERRKLGVALFCRLDQAREFVLNRNAHFDVESEDTLSAEVGAAIETVQELTIFLREQPWQNEHFQSGRVLDPLEKMRIHLVAARQLVSKGAFRQCQNSMKQAYAVFWLWYGKELGVLSPVGSELSAHAALKAAEAQEKLPFNVKSRMDLLKGYLLGCVKARDFDPVKFEEAAKLIEVLAGCSPAASATEAT